MRLALVALAVTTVAVAGFTAEAPAPHESGAKQTVTFQEGVNGYAGTVDLEIWAVSPNTCLNGNPNASSDENNDGDESQIVRRSKRDRIQAVRRRDAVGASASVEMVMNDARNQRIRT